jgi:hypothetical protein
VSVRIAIIGNTLSGKSTVAALVGLQLAKLRDLDEKPLAILTKPTTAYQPFSVNLARTRTLGGILKHLHSAGGPVILDDCTETYSLIVAAWREQSSEHRDRAGLPRKARMNPEEWAIVNAKNASLYAAASEISADFIEIHRQGRVYVPDADLGLVDGEGVAAGGQATSGSADLTLLLGGGLRDKYRTSGARVLTVLNDTAQIRNGGLFELPRLTSPESVRILQRALGKFLERSLKKLIQWTDAEAQEWKASKEADVPDTFSEAFEQAQRAEASVISAEVAALFALKGLAGQKSENIQGRAKLLMEHFGVGDVASLDEVPSAILRGKLPHFRLALDRWESQKAVGAA